MKKCKCENFPIACLDCPSIFPESSPAWICAVGILLYAAVTQAAKLSDLSPAIITQLGFVLKSISLNDIINTPRDFVIVYVLL